MASIGIFIAGFVSFPLVIIAGGCALRHSRDPSGGGLVIRLLPLVLLLSGCATVRPYANCPNAKAALALAERVVDRVCPMDVR
ncbi:hypothetical protein KRZ98_10085 [Sphingobium sp. AS12]|uniref:hypothetical protein n=1 Tax=Sphingobium sp. AS12 TaxID=2849495 RepID=UPI001C317FCC|nr:hypothetical protein [Sphingobium sp. AS12]MBV2148634.1 hypothetical protein [Sphingobium sp. AS12]